MAYKNSCAPTSLSDTYVCILLTID